MRRGLGSRSRSLLDVTPLKCRNEFRLLRIACKIRGLGTHLPNKFTYYCSSEENPYHPEIKKWLLCFFSLSYLRPEDVPSAFCTLMNICPNDPACQKFANYIAKNYINSATFPPKWWASVFLSDCITTNNATESYIKKFKATSWLLS